MAQMIVNGTMRAGATPVMRAMTVDVVRLLRGLGEAAKSRKKKAELDRVAPDMIRVCKSEHGCFKAYIKQCKFKEARNQYECEAIAQAVDAFLAGGVHLLRWV
jgi:hypothetical protein